MYIMILNPNSGRGTALRRLPEVEEILHQQGIEYKIEQDHDETQTADVVRRALAENPEGIIALGGDGTLFRVANGMAGSDVPLVFVSCGTGNDFVRSLKLPADPIEALKLQLNTAPARIDVGCMNDTCFLNVAGTGFDVDVLRLADKYKEKYSGLKAYLFALIAALKAYKPMTAMVSLDGKQEEEMSFAILSVGNGRYFGGGMKAVPDAIVNDGLFDVIIVKPVRKFVVLPLVALYIAGLHTKVKMAKLHRCKSVSIRREGSTINLDGELLDANFAEFKILPGALAVRIPGL